MMKTNLFRSLVLGLVGLAFPAVAFQNNNLVVLRAGNGELGLKLRQAPVFIDEFVPGKLNAMPVSTVTIPTNGPEAMFFNGHAATEGVLARSEDHRWLSFAGYGGTNLLQVKGTPSMLDIGRAFCAVDAAGMTHTKVYRLGAEETKMNPRGHMRQVKRVRPKFRSNSGVF